MCKKHENFKPGDKIRRINESFEDIIDGEVYTFKKYSSSLKKGLYVEESDWNLMAENFELYSSHEDNFEEQYEKALKHFADTILKALYDIEEKEKKSYKYIKYTAKLIDEYKNVSVAITEQTHRNNEFGKNSKSYFEASNGIILYSVCYPESRKFDFFLLGNESNKDNYNLLLSLEQYAKFVEAVEEYNECFK